MGPLKRLLNHVDRFLKLSENILTMQTVKVNKSELIAALKANKIKHDALFLAAVEGYWKSAQIKLLEMQKELDAKKPLETHLDLNYPVSYAESYESSIEMAQMSVDDIIVLTQREFNSYIRNKWEFVAAFNISNSKYNSASL